MELRDYFAAKTLPTIIAEGRGRRSIMDMCQEAYEYADQMMVQRKI